MQADRVNIINTLQLLANLEAQKSYERNVPIADVPAELTNQWFDDFYHPERERFRSGFEADELSVLEEFHNFFSTRVDSLPSDLEQLHQSFAWKEVVGKAQWVLTMLGWTDIEAEYDT